MPPDDIESERDRIKRDFFADGPLPAWMEGTLAPLEMFRNQPVVFGQAVAQVRTAMALERAIDRLVDANNTGTRTMARLTGMYVWLTGAIAAATLVAAVATGVQVWTARQEARVERSARWGELRNAMWEYFDLHDPRGIDRLAPLPPGERSAYFTKVGRVLDSQIGNPVLLRDRYALGLWRNAISSARTGARIIDMGADPDGKRTVIHAGSILKDVSRVWARLVLNAGEVSATGGRPSPP
jgi:hypothetical protein